MTRLYNGAGQPLELGPSLGRGGEGSVHEIAGRPGFVAKVYHQPIGGDKALKLDSMARQAHPGLLEIAAWPVDVLRVRPDAPVQGFVMPKVNRMDSSFILGDSFQFRKPSPRCRGDRPGTPQPRPSWRWQGCLQRNASKT